MSSITLNKVDVHSTIFLSSESQIIALKFIDLCNKIFEGGVLQSKMCEKYELLLEKRW